VDNFQCLVIQTFAKVGIHIVFNERLLPTRQPVDAVWSRCLKYFCCKHSFTELQKMQDKDVATDRLVGGDDEKACRESNEFLSSLEGTVAQSTRH